MKNLLEFIVKNIVTKSDEVVVEELQDGEFTILKVTASADDMGKLIGKNGKVAQALRSIIRTANKDKDKKYLIKIGSPEQEEK